MYINIYKCKPFIQRNFWWCRHLPLLIWLQQCLKCVFVGLEWTILNIFCCEGNDTELHCLRKSLQGVIWILWCRQPDRCVCCRPRSERSCVRDVNGPVKVPANIFIWVYGLSFWCCRDALMAELWKTPHFQISRIYLWVPSGLWSWK